MKERNIKAEIKEKLHDPILSDNLARFAKQYPQARLKAYANVDDIDELRNELRDMKKQTVAHIEEVADKFQASLEERGAKVFRAKDGDELKAQLLQICKENNIHRIVKSKSMATEEIHLNDFLEQQGLRVKEMDLGDKAVNVIEVKTYNPYLKREEWTVESMRWFNKSKGCYEWFINTNELIDYLTKHKNDEVIKDFNNYLLEDVEVEGINYD